MVQRSAVLPPVAPLTEQDARHLLAAGLLKPVHEQGPTRVGLTIGCNEKTVRSARDEQTTLRLDLAFNTLLADPASIDALLAHYGYQLSRRHADAANDLLTAAGVIGAMGELVARLADGKRCRNDTLAIAALLRPHMPAIHAIMREADEIVGAVA
jgi:hypothetical protein